MTQKTDFFISGTKNNLDSCTIPALKVGDSDIINMKDKISGSYTGSTPNLQRLYN